MSKLEFQTTNVVRYSDCDLHGHMNHASFISFFEQARMEYFRALGMDPKSRDSIPFIVVRVEADYRAQAHLLDEVTVQLGVTRFGKTSITVGCEVRRMRDDLLLCEMSSVMVMYDYVAQQPIPVTDAVRAAVAQLKSAS